VDMSLAEHFHWCGEVELRQSRDSEEQSTGGYTCKVRYSILSFLLYPRPIYLQILPFSFDQWHLFDNPVES
jgi:hypothetical protein